MKTTDIGKLKRNDRVEVGGKPGTVTGVHEPQWIDHKTLAKMQVLQGAYVLFDGDNRMAEYVHCDKILLLPNASVEASPKTNSNAGGLESSDLLSLGLKVEDAAKDLLVHAMEFRDDWRKGDFKIPDLARYDMESMEGKFKPLFAALQDVARYRLQHGINLRDDQ